MHYFLHFHQKFSSNPVNNFKEETTRRKYSVRFIAYKQTANIYENLQLYKYI